jgi:hypothetical protein
LRGIVRAEGGAKAKSRGPTETKGQCKDIREFSDTLLGLTKTNTGESGPFLRKLIIQRLATVRAELDMIYFESAEKEFNGFFSAPRTPKGLESIIPSDKQ